MPLLAQGADETLAALLSLSRKVRGASDIQELSFIAVNESFQLRRYRQAALWLRTGRDLELVALSGLSEFDQSAPYVQWLKALGSSAELRSGPVQSLASSNFKGLVQEQWNEWWPAYACAIPLAPQRGFRGGLLVLSRDSEWSPAEKEVLTEWKEILQFAFAALASPSLLRRLFAPLAVHQGERFEAADITNGGYGPRLKRWLARRSPAQLLGMLAATLLFFPVRLTVLAEAELVPRNPSVVRAPIDGVVEKIFVQPNQRVGEGEALLAFDRLSLEAQVRVAERALAAAEAELRQAAQRALMQERQKEALAVAQGELEKRKAELAFLEDLSARSTITAPRDGVVLFGDPSEWVGRPVIVGERVMVIADPSDSEVQLWLGLGDAVPVAEGSEVTLYLDASPLSPLEAALTYLSYAPSERPGGNFAYRGRARLLTENRGQARVGLSGTAKLRGETVPFIYWIVRRPWAAARAWLGW